MTRRTVAIGGSVLLAVVAVVVVLLFGVVAPPPVPALTGTDQRLPTAVAALQPRGDGTCVVIIARDGDRTGGHCVDRRAGGGLRVDQQGRLLLRDHARGGLVVTTLDPRTGARVDRRVRDHDAAPVPRVGPTTPAGATEPSLVVDETDGRLALTLLTADGDERVLARLDTVRGYRLEPTRAWSPDGGWVLLTDSEDRLLALGREDGTLVQLASEVTDQPVWLPR